VIEWAERRQVPVTSPRGKHGAGILCIAPPDPASVHQRLRSASIIASLREGSIRLSPHFYNTIDEMHRVVEVLDRTA
jgi:selenocysteine lyase/cysteine desulfurase